MSIISLLAVVVNVILVNQGSYAISKEEWNTIQNKTKEIYERELGRRSLKLKFRAPITLSNETESPSYSLSDSKKAYYDWRDRLRRERRKGLFLVILPPTSDGFITGLARVDCFKSLNLTPVVLFLKSKTDSGETRIIHSAYAVVHELAHAMNAGHTDSMTIMNPNPLPWLNEYPELPFDIKSKREIRRCVKKRI